MRSVKEEHYSNGQLRYQHLYKDGKLDGISMGWYIDGSIKYKCQYKDGKNHGTIENWTKEGQVLSIHYWLYNKITTKEEYQRHELIEHLSGA